MITDNYICIICVPKLVLQYDWLYLEYTAHVVHIFRHFGFYDPKDLNVFGFQIFWVRAT